MSPNDQPIALLSGSLLSTWMRANHDEFKMRLDAKVPNWTVLAELFADAGLTDRYGNKPNPESARQLWTRIKKEMAEKQVSKPRAETSRRREVLKRQPVSQPSASSWGWLYALTGVGQDRDLTKVGYTYGQPIIRARQLIHKNAGRFFEETYRFYHKDRVRVKISPGRTAIEAGIHTLWVATSSDPPVDEAIVHGLLNDYLAPDYVAPKETFRAGIDVILSAISAATDFDPKQAPVTAWTRPGYEARYRDAR